MLTTFVNLTTYNQFTEGQPEKVISDFTTSMHEFLYFSRKVKGIFDDFFRLYGKFAS
jgi:hypothetical protein